MAEYYPVYTSTANTTNFIWTDWVMSTGSTTLTMNSPWQTWVSTNTSLVWSAPSEEERATQRAAAAARQREVAEAKERAEALLRYSLDEEQAKRFAERREFVVTSRSGRRYRITHGTAGNVLELHPESEKTLARYCIHPAAHLPEADVMLAQKLLLETDEEAFLRIANRTAA
jgi:hypothetical protein